MMSFLRCRFFLRGFVVLLLVGLGGARVLATVPTGLSGTPTIGTSAFSTAGNAAVTTADVTVSGIKYWAVTGQNNVDFHVPVTIFPPADNFVKADGPGIYFNVGSFVAVTPNRVLTVARTSNLGTFTLSTVVIGGFAPGDSFLNIQVVGVDLNDQNVAFTIGGSASTTHSGSGQKTLTLGGGTATPLKAFKLSFDLPGAGTAASDFTLISFTIANATNPSIAPVYVGATTTLPVVQGSTANAATALLHINDPDVGETITWSQNTAPAHGTLSFAGGSPGTTTASAGSSDITPGGAITYTPTAGYAGPDSFIVQAGDGVATVNRTITVSVTPAAPSAPDLAAASDTGSSSTDNITKAASLNFSGTGAAAGSTVTIFLDKNNNATYNAGTDPVITCVANGAGAWSGTGLSTSGVTDGTYNVYAFATSATGSLTGSLSSALSVTLDTAPPTIVSVVRLTPSTQATASGASSVVFRVTYSKAVTGVVAANFQIEAVTGNVTGTIGTITGGPTAYDVQVTGLTGTGEFRLKVVN